MLNVDGFLAALLESMEVDKQERQCCEALLSVYNEPLSALVADDDGAEEVVAVPLTLLT